MKVLMMRKAVLLEPHFLFEARHSDILGAQSLLTAQSSAPFVLAQDS